MERSKLLNPQIKVKNIAFLKVCVFEEIDPKIILAELQRTWNAFECLPQMFETLNVANIMSLQLGQIPK